jgi:ATP-dependent helicase HrpA
LISEQSIVLIEGETGSGKSTQIPQLLCEYFKLLSVPESKPVLVSQPRRLATRTLAERVAAEMG